MQATPTPQINVSKIQGGGGIAGALFAVISTAMLGGVALIMNSMRHDSTGRPWIAPVIKNQ